jgi:hypothetical protein
LVELRVPEFIRLVEGLMNVGIRNGGQSEGGMTVSRNDLERKG